MMKKILLGAGASLMLLAGGCVTEANDPYAPYYYPNTTPPFSQRSTPTTSKVASLKTEKPSAQFASTSANPAN